MIPRLMLNRIMTGLWGLLNDILNQDSVHRCMETDGLIEMENIIPRSILVSSPPSLFLRQI